MAIGKISFIRQDGNLNSPAIGQDHISGLLFDIPAGTPMPSGIKLGDVIQLFSVNEAVSLGITAYSTKEDNTNFFYGIPHYHISEYFRMKSDGSLYVMFANCETDWSAIKTIQSVAQGNIRQLGIWTSKLLWTTPLANEDPYVLNIVADVNAVAEELADEHRPLSVILSANTSYADSSKADKTLKLTRIPKCLGDWPRVTALLGQASSETVKSMQLAYEGNPTIGCVGTALGCVAEAKVCESIAWVDQFNLYDKNYANIEFGFGDMNIVDEGNDFVSTLPFESLSPTQIDEIDDKGYVFPIKYAGRDSGTYFSKDRTCSNGDYRTIARNRTIDKSRRAVRNALLPYLNAPVLVNPSNGYLSEVETKKYQNVVNNILTTMEGNGEISGSTVLVDTKQNVLETDTIKIQYAIIPIGTSTNIIVTEGFALTTA